MQRVRAGGAVQADLPPHAAEGDGGGPEAHHGITSHPVALEVHCTHCPRDTVQR